VNTCIDRRGIIRDGDKDDERADAMTIADVGPERIDVWVFRVGIAIPVVCLVGIVVWRLLAYGATRLRGQRRPVRESPEPGTTSSRNEPERLERACAAMEEKLAQMYLDLAESWLRAGQRQQAVSVWQKVADRCPETPQAQVARNRLRE
jgi:hypothetical protein